MSMSILRRELLIKYLSISGVVGISGCLSMNDSDKPNNPEVGELSIPNPIIDEVRMPELDVSDPKMSDGSGGSNNYSATIINNSITGEIKIVLYSVPDGITREDIDSELFDPSEELNEMNSEIKRIESNSELDYETSANINDEQGFWFTAVPVSAQIKVTNRGGSGKIEILTKRENGEVENKKKLNINNGESKTTRFSTNGENLNKLSVTAKPIENQ